MDIRQTTPPHIVIEGENLTRERLGGPWSMHPSHFINGLAVAVIIIAIGAALVVTINIIGVPA